MPGLRGARKAPGLQLEWPGALPFFLLPVRIAPGHAAEQRPAASVPTWNDL